MTHAQIRWISWSTSDEGGQLYAHVPADNVKMTLCGIEMPVYWSPASLSIPPCGVCQDRVIAKLRLTQGM